MDINEKLIEFEKSVEKLSNNDFEKIEKQVEDEINQAILDELLEYEQKKQISFEKITQNIEKDYNKKVYNYEIECKKQILEEEKKIVGNIKKETIENLKKFVGSNDYLHFLQENIKNALQNITQKQGTTIGITKKDIEKYKNSINEKFGLELITIDDKYIGGCILENKMQGIYIDNTILNSVNEKLNV